jgi:hypothetical protein
LFRIEQHDLGVTEPRRKTPNEAPATSITNRAS